MAHQLSHARIMQLLALALLSMSAVCPPSVVHGQEMGMGMMMAPMAAASGPSAGVAAAPGPSSVMNDCLPALVNMSDCLSYVTPGSNVTVPDKPCCPELAALVEGNPVCLCTLLASNSSSSSSLGIDIDVKRALKLPSVCKVKTPPVSLCSMIGVPVAGIPTAAPATSPSDGASPSAAMGGEPASSSPNGAAARHSVVGLLAPPFLLAAALLHSVAFPRL